MKENIRIVLINTSHPGNIGSAARAMKTMALDKLYLVSPQKFPDDQATALASGANDILDNAVVVDTLDEAIADCALVMGTSARMRRVRWPQLEPREAVEQIVSESKKHPVAILFGTERIGLTNEELDRCHTLINVPTNPEYGSLNVASAVQILSYELRLAELQEDGSAREAVLSSAIVNEKDESEPATSKEFEGLIEHAQQMMVDVDFIDPNHPEKLLRQVRRIFNRTRLTQREVNILRGIFAAAQKKVK